MNFLNYKYLKVELDPPGSNLTGFQFLLGEELKS